MYFIVGILLTFFAYIFYGKKSKRRKLNK